MSKPIKKRPWENQHGAHPVYNKKYFTLSPNTYRVYRFGAQPKTKII